MRASELTPLEPTQFSRLRSQLLRPPAETCSAEGPARWDWTAVRIRPGRAVPDRRLLSSLAAGYHGTELVAAPACCRQRCGPEAGEVDSR
jgi:hypothetical protein